MGYTTTFKGRFKIKNCTFELMEQINHFSSERHDDPMYPGIWCQWVVKIYAGKPCLEWDGTEKFTDYVEWLQYVIDNFIRPARLDGRVTYQGERYNDSGVIVVKNNIIQSQKDIIDTEVAKLIEDCEINNAELFIKRMKKWQKK